MQTLYCDESGFTGPDLLNKAQPYFSYGSVLIEPLEASELVAKTQKDFRLQGNELKGSRMLNSSSGRKAALYLFRELSTHSITTVLDKRFSLAGKLYEYIFDPVVEGNSALYNTGFHKCVTNLLYEQFTNNNPRTIELLTHFSNVSENAILRGWSSRYTPEKVAAMPLIWRSSSGGFASSKRS